MDNLIKRKKVLQSIDGKGVLRGQILCSLYGGFLKKEARLFRDKKDFINSKSKFFHGTYSSFEKFSLVLVGKNTGWNNAKLGIFFLDNKEYVSEFLNITKDYSPDNKIGTIKEVYLIFNNSLDLTIEGIFNNKDQAALLLNLSGYIGKWTNDEALEIINDEIGLGDITEFIELIYTADKNKEKIIAAGFDSIVSQFGKDKYGNIIKEYVAFYTQQIFTKDDLEDIYSKSR